jgi:hypothetical protein
MAEAAQRDVIIWGNMMLADLTALEPVYKIFEGSAPASFEE